MMPENGPGRMNSEGESCHSGKLRLPFAAAAARRAVPGATQTADRFHLLKNLGEALEGVLARHLAAPRKRQIETARAAPLLAKPTQEPPNALPKNVAALVRPNERSV